MCSTIRVLCGEGACSISRPGRGWSRSPPRWPARAETEASDIDAFAIAAIEANAAENEVSSVARRLEDLIGADEGWDVVLAGDVCLRKGHGDGRDRLARRRSRDAARPCSSAIRAATYLALDRLECVIEYRVPVTRELEDSEIKRTGVFRFR